MEITQELLIEIAEKLDLGEDADDKKGIERQKLLAIIKIISEKSIKSSYNTSPNRLYRITFVDSEFNETEICFHCANGSDPWLCAVQTYASDGNELVKIESAEYGNQKMIEELYNSLSKPKKTG